MFQEALYLERSNGGEWTERKCRKDKDHDLWYGPGPSAEFRRVSMCRLSYWKPPGRSSRSCYQFCLSPPPPTPPHPPFFQDMWVTCTAGVWSAMLHVSETWPLTKPNFQRLQRNDRSMIRQICNVKQQDIVTNRSNEPLARLGIEEQDLILKESSAGMDMWNAPMVQSRQPLTYRLMENVGLGGPRWHGSSWQRGIAESWSSRLSTLMIDILEIWRKICYACSKPASYLEGSPMMWMLPLYLHVNKKKSDDNGDCHLLNFMSNYAASGSSIRKACSMTSA